MKNKPFDIMQDSLLTAEQICEKLAISRSTLDRWRKIETFSNPGVIDRLLNGHDEPAIPFPKPTLDMGRSPRWSANEINLWIAEMQKSKGKRPA